MRNEQVGVIITGDFNCTKVEMANPKKFDGSLGFLLDWHKSESGPTFARGSREIDHIFATCPFIQHDLL
jgi:hypothetical protein